MLTPSYPHVVSHNWVAQLGRYVMGLHSSDGVGSRVPFSSPRPVAQVQHDMQIVWRNGEVSEDDVLHEKLQIGDD